MQQNQDQKLKDALDEINALKAQLAEVETGRDEALDSCFSWSERAKEAEARADVAALEIERLKKLFGNWPHRWRDQKTSQTSVVRGELDTCQIE